MSTTDRPHPNTLQLANGRWAEILPALGVPVHLINGKSQPCPGCGGRDRFRYSNHAGNGGYFCRQCGPGSGVKLVCMVRGWDFKRTYEEIDRIIGNLPPPAVVFHHTRAACPSIARVIFGSSQRIAGNDPVGLYLHARGIWPADYNDLHRVLRYVPELRYQADHSRHPGLIAVFSDRDGKPATLHRTYLTSYGCKAAFKPNRMFLKGQAPTGGAVRLSAPGDDLSCMGIAEGIETALACRALRSGLPVWAATGDSLLKGWVPPPEAREITIFGDNDRNFAGQSAAYALAKRLTMEAQRDQIDRRIYVEIPTKIGADFNDVLHEQQRSEEACAR